MGSRERRIEKARSAIEHVPRADKRVAAALAGGVAAAALAGEGLRRFASRHGEVRDELGDDLYGSENQRYRDIGRGLSGLRDSEVLIEALNRLAERFGGPAGE